MPLPPRAVSLEGHQDVVRKIAFVPAGNRIITACDDGNGRVFNADTAALTYVFDGHKPSSIEALAALGADLVATGDLGGVICVWDARAKRCLYRAEHGIAVWSIAALSPSSFVAGLEGRTLLFFQHRGGEDVAVIHALPDAHSNTICSIASHGQRMVTGSWDTTAKVWDVDSREVLGTLEGRNGHVEAVAMNATHIVTAVHKGIRVWDGETYELLHNIEDKHESAIGSVLILGDNRVITASDDRTVAVTDLATGATIDSVLLDFSVWSAAANSNGRIAACGGYRHSAIAFPAP